MARGSRGQRRSVSHHYRFTPYLLPNCKRNICEDAFPKKCSRTLDKKEWEDVTCSVCMEYPHNAVLLLCSSHDKGCRPYMCGTSFRHSNCLDQYRKAYTKVVSSNNQEMLRESNFNLGENEVSILACPLCRGQVKGWTVVEPARDFLNAKKRTCMQVDCTFSGTYKELKKHVRAEHPLARPRAVDPAHEQKWRWLESEREREDVISIVTSTMPGATVFGDYVIEGHHNDSDTDEEDAVVDADAAERNERFQMGMEAMNFFLLLHAAQQGNNDLDDFSGGRRLVSGRSVRLDLDNEDDDNDRFNEGNNNDDVSLASHFHHHGGGTVLFDRSSRRRRQRHTTQR